MSKSSKLRKYHAPVWNELVINQMGLHLEGVV